MMTNEVHGLVEVLDLKVCRPESSFQSRFVEKEAEILGRQGCLSWEDFWTSRLRHDSELPLLFDAVVRVRVHVVGVLRAEE